MTSLISEININYKKFSSSEIKLRTNEKISDYNFEEKKTITQFSYSNKKMYDLSKCKAISFPTQLLLVELKNKLPDYESFVKIKNTQYIEDEEKKFNMIRFYIEKDDKNNKLWISPIVFFDEDNYEEIKLNEEVYLKDMLNE